MNQYIENESLEQDCQRIRGANRKKDEQIREDVYDKVCDMIENLASGNLMVHTESVDIAYLTADLVMEHFCIK